MGQKAAVLNQVQWYATLLVQKKFFLYTWRNCNILFYNTDNQHNDLRPAYIKRDKKDEGTKLKVWRKYF